MRHRCQRHLLHNFNLNLNFSSGPAPPHPPIHAAAAMSRCCRNPPPHCLKMGGRGGGGERELFAFTSFAFLIKREKYSKPFAIVSAIFKFNLHNIPNRRRASAHPSPCCKFFPLANYSFICLCCCCCCCYCFCFSCCCLSRRYYSSCSLEFANRLAMRKGFKVSVAA